MALKDLNDFQIHGVLSRYWEGEQNPLDTSHRHNDVEVNLLTAGRMAYSIDGKIVEIPVGALSVFWAGFSHRINEWQPRGKVWSISIPMTIFLKWPLPEETFVHNLMHGDIIIETDRAQAAFDKHLVSRWHRDLSSPPPVRETEEIVLLELQARFRRLAVSHHAISALHAHHGQPERIASMLQFIASHYAEPITVADIAEAAKTNPCYAMEMFKRACGVSVMHYVNDQRLAHARRLLLNSDAKVLDIALEAGFGSLSRFHEVFRKATGKTPRAYARQKGEN